MMGGRSVEPLTDKDGDPIVDRRLEILREIETIFPGLPAPQVLDLARWVEDTRRPKMPSERQPRTWTNLDAIPSTVKAITDKGGNRAEPEVVLGKRKWFFTAEPFDGVRVCPEDGPFTEVLENE